MANATIVHGWQSQPNNRGTFDIVKGCAGTILLVCWSSVCPNVPSSKKGYRTRFAGRFKLFLLGLLGPEFVFILAMGQMNAAWRAKKALPPEAPKDWSLRHCFFVNMGGLHLAFRDRSNAELSTFPVDCEQLKHLFVNHHIGYPEISKDDIDDRNKADNVTRAIAVVQALWFLADIFGRISQGLFVTTLELTTVGFVALMTCCSVCWWRKPMDISQPIVVHVNEDLSVVLRGGNTENESFGRTPLSFINRHEWFLSQIFFNYIQILRNIKLLPSASTNPTKADHFLTIDFPETDMKWDLTFAWVIPAYGAIFMAAWNFTFPTMIERRLWRISAIICLSFNIFGAILASFWHHRAVAAKMWASFAQRIGIENRQDAQATRRVRDHAPDVSKFAMLLHYISRWFSWMRNLSPNDDPMLTIPARLWLAATTLALAYLFSRVYILTEDVIGLRRLPTSAFQTVDWGQYSPIL